MIIIFVEIPEDNSLSKFCFEFISTNSTDPFILLSKKLATATMNLSKRSGDKELFSGTIVKENTMNLSKRSGDKELFSEERSSKENIRKKIQ